MPTCGTPIPEQIHPEASARVRSFGLSHSSIHRLAEGMEKSAACLVLERCGHKEEEPLDWQAGNSKILPVSRRPPKYQLSLSTESDNWYFGGCLYPSFNALFNSSEWGVNSILKFAVFLDDALLTFSGAWSSHLALSYPCDCIL